MQTYLELLERLKNKPQTWLITGAAGFIGSNLLQTLLSANQRVIGLDNFSTGKKQNVVDALNAVKRTQRASFVFVEGDIRDQKICQQVCRRANYLIHLAAAGSVSRSIDDPFFSNENNVTGFLNILLAARDQGVKRVVYASSSAVYGDEAELPKQENKLGHPLSPYAVTKLVNELYARVFEKIYQVESIGLRYFNVFGPRQDPNGPYAAVIPRWVDAMIRNEPSFIFGDGSTSRDFCYVANAIQANLLAACSENPQAIGQVFNVAVNDRTSLLDLFEMIRCKLAPKFEHLREYRPGFRGFRAGDIKHSQADIAKAQILLGYSPTHTVEQGLDESLAWYKQDAVEEEVSLV